jgi:hypothetical protein
MPRARLAENELRLFVVIGYRRPANCITSGRRVERAGVDGEVRAAQLTQNNSHSLKEILRSLADDRGTGLRRAPRQRKCDRGVRGPTDAASNGVNSVGAGNNLSFGALLDLRVGEGRGAGDAIEG